MRNATSFRPLAVIAVAALTIGVFASSARAAEPVLPEGYPECRMGYEGIWYSTSSPWDPRATAEQIQIEGDQISWSFRDQTRKLTLLEQDQTRWLFEVDREFDDHYSDGSVVPYFKYVVVENPIGWLGIQYADEVWPCEMTITFCRQKRIAYALLREDFEIASVASEGCIGPSLVPYPPAGQ